MDEHSKNAGRKPWQPPALKSVGTMEQALQGGTGKLSQFTVDPGESRKTKPSG